MHGERVLHVEDSRRKVKGLLLSDSRRSSLCTVGSSHAPVQDVREADKYPGSGQEKVLHLETSQHKAISFIEKAKKSKKDTESATKATRTNTRTSQHSKRRDK